MKLFVGSTNLLSFGGAKNLLDGSTITSTTPGTSMIATVESLDGTVIASVTLIYVSTSITVNNRTYKTGNFQGQLPASAPLVVGTRYNVRFVGQANGAQLTELIENVKAEYKTEKFKDVD